MRAGVPAVAPWHTIGVGAALASARDMKMLLVAFGLSASPTLGFADSPSSSEAQAQDARLVPVVRAGEYVGLKVHAIKPGSRLARAGFENGDIIEQVDNRPITSDAGARALHDRVLGGTATATIIVRRRHELVTLTSRVLSSRAK